MYFHPFPTQKTARLILRQVTEADAWEIYRIYNNDRSLEFIERDKLVSEETAMKIIEKHQKQRLKGSAVYWAIALAAQPEKMIGAVGLTNISCTHCRAEIRFVLHPENHGKKLMTEALQQILNYGFHEMNLNRVEACINQSNKAAIATLRKMSFLQEALFTERHFYKGQFHDTAVFALLKKRFLYN